jgi:hypothetical protein
VPEVWRAKPQRGSRTFADQNVNQRLVTAKHCWDHQAPFRVVKVPDVRSHMRGVCVRARVCARVCACVCVCVCVCADVRLCARCEVSDWQREIRRIVMHHARCMCVCAYGTCMVQPVS